jgi:hypothetical protein
MKTAIKIKSLLLIAAIAVSFSSCKKDQNLETDQSAILEQLGAVAITSTNSVSGVQTTNSTDSIYAINACKKDRKKTKVEEAALLPAIVTYLKANYEGYTFKKAFGITPKEGTAIESYVVGIMFNGKPAALKFSPTGVFVQVLELREGEDIKRKGDHRPGGCFDNRDGKQKDTIAVTALPQNIKQYFAANYASDTLKAAFVNKDASIIVISVNKGFFATSFASLGTFIARKTLPPHPGKDKEITASALPANVTSYLSTTYPNYVFKKAYADTTKGYLVFIDANMTKYAVAFNAAGAFVEAKIIR